MPKERGDESLRALEIISKEKDEKTIARIEEIGAVAKAAETAEKTRRRREAIDKARELEREQAERMGCRRNPPTSRLWATRSCRSASNSNVDPTRRLCVLDGRWSVNVNVASSGNEIEGHPGCVGEHVVRQGVSVTSRTP
jgi:hypothetical protein